MFAMGSFVLTVSLHHSTFHTTAVQHIVTAEGQTLLPEYVGLYRLTVADKETYWIVQRNVLPARLPIHVKYDLKGSTIDRSASTKERVSRGRGRCSAFL